jgi:hypothetical protein
VPNKAPLCCLEINILTGLRPPSQQRLEELFKQVDATAQFPFDLASNEDLKQKLIAAAEGDNRLKRSIEVAFDRITALKPAMEQARDRIFQGKKSVNNPHFVMSMGGGGSGKSGAAKLAGVLSGNNYVEASLDAFREHSDLYTLLLKANHHADDYHLVQSMAKTLRDWVEEKAREEKYNLLYDGTGIDYAGRYDKITAAFKKNGYNTHLYAIDRPMGEAITAIKDRHQKTGRALVWPVATGKHSHFPDSFLSAAADPNFDHVMLFTNDKTGKTTTLIAETHRASTGQSQCEIKPAENTQSLLAAINHKSKYVHALPEEMPEENCGTLNMGRENDIHRTLAIYDVNRFIEMLGKRKLNTAASSPEGLKTPSHALRFLVGEGTSPARTR